jgi:hypothetical protein
LVFEIFVQNPFYFKNSNSRKFLTILFFKKSQFTDSFSGYRSARITEIMEEKFSGYGKFALGELEDIQMDIKSLAAIEFITTCEKYSENVLAVIC